MKSGFVALIGRSNVGKSTLLNALVGTKVAIITPKPQTTRHAIRGIVHDPAGQIVFVDTPGVFDKTRDPLTESMNREVRNALEGIDAIVYVVDPTRAVGPEEHRVHAMVETATKTPKIMVINKCDLPERKRPFEHEYKRFADQMDAVFEVSALHGTNLKQLVQKLFELMPEGEPYYPEFQFTDIETKKWIEELIREKIFIQMHQEIPYSVTVVVDEMEKRDDTLYIKARVLTADERYKKMLIGKGASQIKQMGHTARRELETALQTKIFLDLEVEVDEHWVDRETHR